MNDENLINKDLFVNPAVEASRRKMTMLNSVDAVLSDNRSTSVGFSREKIIKVLTMTAVIGIGVFIITSLPNGATSNNEIMFVQAQEIENPDTTDILTNHITELKPYNIVQEADTDYFTAKAYYVFNPTTGLKITEKNATEQLPIASLTKLLTVIIALDTYDLNDTLTVTEDYSDMDWALGLQPGDKITVRDAITSALIASYNDAGMVLADSYPYGGREGFVNMMNEYASRFAMFDSHFSNPVGYDDPENYSTASDLSRLVYFVLQRETILDIVSKPEAYVSFKRNSVTQTFRIFNTNYLIGRVSNVYGLKTGSTEGAGQCLITYIRGSQSSDEIVIIILGSKDRFDETKNIINYVQKYVY